ncbi:aminopeptidase N-like [Bolinopsis microptera]|uniref:aminopeptidase N-like n=1 Tax=Bolinopsis microptera TaxID=2820187 RepID=UPI003079BB2D
MPYEVEECVNVAKAKFDAYKNGIEPKSEFKITMLNTVMSGKLRDVIDNWNFLWKKFQNSDSASEQQTIYQALGLIQDKDTLKNFSEFCLDPILCVEVTPSTILGRSIAQTKLGREVSWDFLVLNWQREFTEEFTDALFAVECFTIAEFCSDFR